MSYTPTTWETGDTITAVKLNNMESGISGAGGNLVVVATEDGGYLTLDKTGQEILDALEAGMRAVIVYGSIEGERVQQMELSNVAYDSDSAKYVFRFYDYEFTGIVFSCSALSGYPSRGGAES